MPRDRPRLLDLFCGGGGASMGYHRAGFEVTGVDNVEQAEYPFRFERADALAFPLEGFDAIHASPPCQGFSHFTRYHAGRQEEYLDLVEPTRRRLEDAGVPYVIENVIGAPVRKDLVLCGEMFGLRVHRHRVFEVGRILLLSHPHMPHALRGAEHNCDVAPDAARIVAGNFSNVADAREAMGIDWLSRRPLAQAIPPAYTELIGEQILRHLQFQE